MKKSLIMFSLFLSFCFVSPVSASNTFLLTIPSSGWFNSGTLFVNLSAIICNGIGNCMISGYGYEENMGSSIINFKGDMQYEGNYLNIWIKGEGRGTTTKTILVYYDIFVKIYTPSFERTNNIFHCLRHTNIDPANRISSGNVSITFY